MSRSTISTFQLFALFPNEETARVYLEDRLWPKGPVCPDCKSGERVSALGTCATRKAGYYRCLTCDFDFTIRTNTIFERSKVPLHKWLYSMYLLVTARKGISSLQLAKEIGVTQKTAWFILGRLREACGGPDGPLDKLRGVIEIDEAFFGGKDANKHAHLRAGRRGPVGKVAVLGMRERGGRTRATVIPDRTRGPVSTNSVESVWAVLKRGIHGVYHHTSKKHLFRYVDEFTFRLNEGNVENHTIARLNSFVDATVGKRLTYERLCA